MATNTNLNPSPYWGRISFWISQAGQIISKNVPQLFWTCRISRANWCGNIPNGWKITLEPSPTPPTLAPSPQKQPKRKYTVRRHFNFALVVFFSCFFLIDCSTLLKNLPNPPKRWKRKNSLGGERLRWALGDDASKFTFRVLFFFSFLLNLRFAFHVEFFFLSVYQGSYDLNISYVRKRKVESQYSTTSRGSQQFYHILGESATLLHCGQTLSHFLFRF